ncbi:MAG: hypothetical protein JWM11_5449 [Planctomycetaceae bacterium]|nr:hypothetical protein [Planctomycetaceae bacterium]
MTCLCWLLGILLADLPQVQVETLKSGATSGVLQHISATQISVNDKVLPLTDVLEVRFPAPAAIATPAAAMPPTPIEIALSDGTRFQASAIVFTKGDIKATSPRLGEIAIKKALIKSLRLQADDPQFRDAWQKLLSKETKKDLIVVRKENKLDFIAGVAGEVTDTTVNFLVDGEEFPARREAVYGLIYQPAPPTAKLTATVELQGSDLLQSKLITLQEEKCQIITVSGLTISVPLGQLKTLDFSAGKIRYLSQIDPIDVQLFPFWDPSDYLAYRRNFSGPLGILTPITLRGKPYAKGLAIHSKTILKYRLSGEFRRFQAVMGIDDFAGKKDQPDSWGDVHVKISGDSKILYEGDAKRFDAPVLLDFDVSGVRDLVILVDYGGNLDIGDWLDLADAKLSK